MSQHELHDARWTRSVDLPVIITSNSAIEYSHSIVAVKVTASLCHKLLGESRSDFFLITVVTVYASAVLFVAFRFVIKAMKRTKGRIDWSDWLLLLAIVSSDSPRVRIEK